MAITTAEATRLEPRPGARSATSPGSRVVCRESWPSTAPRVLLVKQERPAASIASRLMREAIFALHEYRIRRSALGLEKSWELDATRVLPEGAYEAPITRLERRHQFLTVEQCLTWRMPRMFSCIAGETDVGTSSASSRNTVPSNNA